MRLPYFRPLYALLAAIFIAGTAYQSTPARAAETAHLRFATHAAFFSGEMHLGQAIDPQMFVRDRTAPAGVGPQKIRHVAGVENLRLSDAPSTPLYSAAGKRLGFTAGSWLGARGVVTITAAASGANIVASFTGLKPYGVYSLFENYFDATEEGANRKNGTTSKTMKSPAGEFELNASRERAGTVEPQIVRKHQTHLTDELERKVIALFALGNSYQDIRAHIAEMYDISLSNGTLNAVTDKLLPELQAWRGRDLEAIYPIVWLDAIHYKIRKNGRYVSKAIYTILGLNIDGKKELLGLYLSDQEGAHHWLSILTACTIAA